MEQSGSGHGASVRSGVPPHPHLRVLSSLEFSAPFSSGPSNGSTWGGISLEPFHFSGEEPFGFNPKVKMQYMCGLWGQAPFHRFSLFVASHLTPTLCFMHCP